MGYKGNGQQHHCGHKLGSRLQTREVTKLSKVEFASSHVPSLFYHSHLSLLQGMNSAASKQRRRIPRGRKAFPLDTEAVCFLEPLSTPAVPT